MNDYELDDVEARPLDMASIQQAAKHLRELEWAVMEAEEALRLAKQRYDQYSCHDMPDLFKLNGLSELTAEDGTKIRVATKTAASVKKDAESKKSVADWLRKHGAESLVKSELVVPVSQKEKLGQLGVTFKEDVTMNTNSIKAFVIDQLGQKDSPATITKEDLPAGLNFFQWDEMEVIRK